MSVTHVSSVRKLILAGTLAGIAGTLALVGAAKSPSHTTTGTTDASRSVAIVPAAQTLDAPPMDAAAVTGSFGWLLTPEQLLVSTDNGTTFNDTAAPVPAGPARAAHFHDAHSGIVAGASDGTITIARTTDTGQTWTSTTVADPALPAGIGYSGLRLAFGTPSRGALMAQVATGSNFSLGRLFTTSDGGTTWTAHQAPVAGVISVQADGVVWLAGGVMGDQLYRSADAGATWTRSQVNALSGRQVAGIGLPIGNRLPVTVLNAGATEFEMMVTTDQGASWHPSKSVKIAGHTAMNVREPVAATAGATVVFDTVGGHAWRVDDGTDLHPSGLPQGVDTVAFADDGRTGWAIAVYGTCAHGKQDCTLHREVVSTPDGGSHWQSIEQWAENVG